MTLVEVLVGLVLLSLLASGSLLGLRQVALAWKSTETEIERLSSWAIGEAFVRSTLEQSYPKLIPPRDGMGQGTVLFSGTPKMMRFVAPSPIAVGGAGFSLVELSAEPHKNIYSLTVANAPFLETLTVPADIEKHEVLSDLKTCHFSYYGRKAMGERDDWHDNWDGELELPKLIRVQWEAHGAKRHAAEILVRPRISVDVACQLDPLTRRCRGR